MALEEAPVVTRALSRDVLASFLPNFEAIKAFEKMQSTVQDVINTGGIDVIQLDAIFAGVQAVATADLLAQVIETLGREPLPPDLSQLESRITALEQAPERESVFAEGLGTAPAPQPFVMPLTLELAIRETDASGDVLFDDSTVLADATGGAVALDLPPAAQAYRRVLAFKKIDASVNAVTIAADGAETIDGAGTQPLAAQYDSLTIQSDGQAWWII